MVLHHFASHMTPPAYEIANSMTTADSRPAAADQRLWKIKRECPLGSQLSGSGDRPLLADLRLPLFDPSRNFTS